MQELPAVMWSLQTTPNRSTGSTLFFLVYGTDAVLATKLDYSSPRVWAYNEETTEEAQLDSLDRLDE